MPFASLVGGEKRRNVERRRPVHLDTRFAASGKDRRDGGELPAIPRVLEDECDPPRRDEEPAARGRRGLGLVGHRKEAPVGDEERGGRPDRFEAGPRDRGEGGPRTPRSAWAGAGEAARRAGTSRRSPPAELRRRPWVLRERVGSPSSRRRVRPRGILAIANLIDGHRPRGFVQEARGAVTGAECARPAP